MIRWNSKDSDEQSDSDEDEVEGSRMHSYQIDETEEQQEAATTRPGFTVSPKFPPFFRFLMLVPTVKFQEELTRG